MCCRVSGTDSKHASHTRVKALDSALLWQPRDTSLWSVEANQPMETIVCLHMQTFTVINSQAFSPKESLGSKLLKYITWAFVACSIDCAVNAIYSQLFPLNNSDTA